MERETIGLNDAEGKPIRLGDIVEFWHCECSAHHAGLTTLTRTCPRQRRAVDYVYKDSKNYYFCSTEPSGGAFAWRYAKGCRVIGKLPDDAALIVDALAFPPIGTMREQIIDQIKNFKLVHSDVPGGQVCRK